MRVFRKGITLVEVLIVTIILATLLGLAYPLSAPMRESAKQASCMGNLRQIYAAVAQYSSDNPGDDIPNLPGISAGFFLKPLNRSVPDAVAWCPDFPYNRRMQLGGSYNMNYLNPAMLHKPDERDTGYLSNQSLEIEREGSKYPIVICFDHDVYFYQPRERDIDPLLARPFAIELHASGSIVKTRRDCPRPLPR